MKWVCWLFFIWAGSAGASPVRGLLERIDPGASGKFCIELQAGEKDFFELDQQGEKVVIRGNNYVSIAAGINWYLKYYAGIHLCWNNRKAKLPSVLPPVEVKERRETALSYRYDLNYCTYSYSMAFWDWERWEQEIDWMALHGVNLALALTGTETVWYNVLQRLGYNPEETGRFIAGPAFLAWWHMNNLEGWGGPNPDSWYRKRVKLQQRILNRMQEYGIEPVLPGYAGMLPHDAGEKLGVEVADPGTWCGFRRPAFLQPEDPAFLRIAGVYYTEMEKLFGKVRFYSMDPFHEGGNAQGVDFGTAGRAVLQAMKRANPDAVWVLQAWQANPRPSLLEAVGAGDVLVLDLSSENRPMWGDPDSPWYRENGFGKHDWIYCMLLNFGGNVGMYGRMDRVISGYYAACGHRQGRTLKGVGMTMEGIESNPVMYELLMELPWRSERFSADRWVTGYVKARYGCDDPCLQQAWRLLARTAYNCPDIREGTVESVFCARPSEEVRSASSWGSSRMYYDPAVFRKAAEAMLEVADRYAGNNNFEYDLVDVVRQAVADRGNELRKEVMVAYRAQDQAEFLRLSSRFLELILVQDSLLGVRREFRLGNWLERARRWGETDREKQLYEWNARVQVTTWGDRTAADEGGLHDYAHKEWAGLLKDFYYPRWKIFFGELQKRLAGQETETIDWYGLEERWTLQQNEYPSRPSGNVIATARWAYEKAKE